MSFPSALFLYLAFLGHTAAGVRLTSESPWKSVTLLISYYFPSDIFGSRLLILSQVVLLVPSLPPYFIESSVDLVI